MKLSEAYEQISNKKFSEVRQDRKEFLADLLYLESLNDYEKIGHSLNPRTYIELTAKIYWYNVAKQNLGKANFKIKLNDINKKLKLKFGDASDFSKRAFTAAKHVGGKYNKAEKQNIIDLYGKYSKNNHKVLFVKTPEIKEIFNLVRRLLSDILKIELSEIESLVSTKKSIEAIKENVVSKEPSKTILLDENTENEPDGINNIRVVKGWIKNISLEQNPFTKEEQKLITLMSFRRGKRASSRQAISFFVSKDFFAYAGLTYQFKLEYTHKNNIKMIAYDKWEKPSLITKFVDEVVRINPKIKKEYFVGISSLSTGDKNTIEGFTRTRIVSRKGSFEKTKTYEFLKTVDDLLCNEKIHFSKLFTSFDEKIKKIYNISSPKLSLSDVDDGFDLIIEIISMLTKMGRAYVVEYLWDDSLISEWNKKDYYDPWKDFYDYSRIRNPKFVNVDNNLLLKVRFSDKSFMSQNFEEILANLFTYSLEIYLGKKSSSVIFKNEVYYVINSLRRGMRKLGFNDPLIIEHLKMSLDLDNNLSNIIEIFEKIGQISGKLDEIYYEDDPDIVVQYLKTISEYIDVEDIEGEQMLINRHPDSSYTQEAKLGNLLYERLNSSISSKTSHSYEEEFDALLRKLKNRNQLIEKDANQLKAVNEMMNMPFSLLIGKAGVGKTTTVALFLKLFIDKNPFKKIGIFTPTGAAGNVLREKINDFGISSNNLTIDTTSSSSMNRKYDLVIFEETSMVQLRHLETSLAKNLGMNRKFILLGDSGQLPSIGLGNLLSQITESKVARNSIIKLVKNYRQKNNDISDFANLIRDYKPSDDELELTEWLKVHEKSISVSDCSSTTPKEFQDQLLEKYDPASREVTITSKNSGTLGVTDINNIIQEKLSKDSNYISTDLEDYAIDSKVMWIKNIKGYFRKALKLRSIPLISNGETGVITKISKNKEGGLIEISFNKFIAKSDIGKLFNENLNPDFHCPGVTFKYKNGNVIATLEISENTTLIPFVLNFASSFHKVQGAQFNIVNIIILNNDDGKYVLSNQHLYTAITRAIENINIYVFSKDVNKTLVDIAKHKEQREQTLKFVLDKLYDEDNN